MVMKFTLVENSLVIINKDLCKGVNKKTLKQIHKFYTFASKLSLLLVYVHTKFGLEWNSRC